MDFKFKKTKVETSDAYYDLFEGGYIKPEKMLLDAEQATVVNNAIEVVKNFLDQASDAGVLETE